MLRPGPLKPLGSLRSGPAPQSREPPEGEHEGNEFPPPPGKGQRSGPFVHGQPRPGDFGFRRDSAGVMGGTVNDEHKMQPGTCEGGRWHALYGSGALWHVCSRAAPPGDATNHTNCG